MKNKSPVLWSITAACLVLTIALNFVMRNAKVSYEEVTATVVSTATKELVNKKTQNRTTFYEVKVNYDGKEYDLQNVHGLSGYVKGRKVKALLSNGKLYANVEGIKSTSPAATVYFVFLFATLGMLFVSATYSSKMKEKQKEAGGQQSK